MKRDFLRLDSGRIPQLDGVRGVAILLVLVAHLSFGVFPHNRAFIHDGPELAGGGFIGVQLFFVLSGFLITGILRDEHARIGRIRFGAFYLRRARRLLPALAAVCIAYAVYALIALPREQWSGAIGSILRALSYTTNIDSLYKQWFPADSKWLNHTWSLAVEEQFYLLWPPIAAIALKRSRTVAAGLALAGIGTTLLLRTHPTLAAHSYELFRWDALLIGCAIAFVPIQVPKHIAALGVPAVIYYALRPLEHPPRNLHLFLASVGCTLFLLFALQTQWASSRPLRWLGDVSYGLYLWHVLIMRFGFPGWVSLLSSLAAAELSRRFIEQPFLVAHAVRAPIAAPTTVPQAGHDAHQRVDQTGS